MEDSFKTTNWKEKRPEEILDFIHKKTNTEKQFEVLKYLILHFPDLKINWLDIFSDMEYFLLSNDRLNDVLFFVDWYSKHDPEDYKERYQFIDREIINYCFFKKDYKNLQKRIEFVKKNPVSAIDILTIRLLFQMIFHGWYEQAIKFCEAVWKPVDESPNLFGPAAYEFVNTLYINKLQYYYETLLNKAEIDVYDFLKKHTEIDFEISKKLAEKIKTGFISDFDRDFVKSCINKEKNDHMLHLNLQFLKYMYHNYNLPFIFSDWLWQFIAELKIFGKHGKDNWFFIDAKTMDKHIISRYDTFLGCNKLEIFGKVWGLEYIFAFFNDLQLINEEQYKQMSENCNYFRNEMMIIAGSNLWNMLFVFDWPETGNPFLDPADKKVFESTFGVKEDIANQAVQDYVNKLTIPERIKQELDM